MLGRPATETQITHARRLWLYALGGLVLFFLVLPSLIVVPLSFSDTRFLQFPPPAYSTRWYEAYFGSREWRQATWISFAAAFLTTVLSTGLGTLAAYSLHTMSGRAPRVLYAFFMMPLIVPAILVAIGTFLLYAQLGLNNTMTGIVLAHSTMAIPLVVITVASGLKSYDMNQEMVARSLGASRFQAFRMVFLPLTRPGLIGAGTLVFILSLGFYVTPALLGGGKVLMIAEYVAVQINDTLRWGLGTMLATTLMLSVLAALWALSRIIDVKRLFGA